MAEIQNLQDVKCAFFSSVLCVFCGTGFADEADMGKLCQKEDVVLHYFCMVSEGCFASLTFHCVLHLDSLMQMLLVFFSPQINSL